MINFIAWIIVGGLAGWIGSKIMKTDASMGVLLNIIVGIIGAFVGGWVVSALLGTSTTDIFSIPGFITALLGSIIVLAIVKAVTGTRRTA